MRNQRLRLEFRMELAGKKPGMISNFYHLNKIFIFVHPGEYEAFICQSLAISIIKFKSMTVALGNLSFIISCMSKRPLGNRAWKCT